MLWKILFYFLRDLVFYLFCFMLYIFIFKLEKDYFDIKYSYDIWYVVKNFGKKLLLVSFEY